MAYRALEQLVNLHDGYLRPFKIAGNELLLVQYDGQVYVIENVCPHMGVPLATGSLEPGNMIRCRAHGIEFSLDTGRAEGPLANAMECLKRFPPVYEGKTVGIDL